MMHPATRLRHIGPEVGSGVFATGPIPRGTVTWALCRLDTILSPSETAALPDPYQPIVEKYGYTDADGNQILCWDIGRYVNHSCDSNLLSLGPGFEIAVRDIAAGEEITGHYAGINLPKPLACRCGAPNCRGIATAEDVLHTWPDLDARTAPALRLARAVAQPLLPFARDADLFWDWADGRVPMPSHRVFYPASWPYIAAASNPPPEPRAALTSPRPAARSAGARSRRRSAR